MTTLEQMHTFLDAAFLFGLISGFSIGYMCGLLRAFMKSRERTR